MYFTEIIDSRPSNNIFSHFFEFKHFYAVAFQKKTVCGIHMVFPHKFSTHIRRVESGKIRKFKIGWEELKKMHVWRVTE